MSEGISVFARNGVDSETYYNHMREHQSDNKPHLTIDDGYDLVPLLHSERRELLETTLGGMDETTTVVIQLKALDAEGQTCLPNHGCARLDDEAHVRQSATELAKARSTALSAPPTFSSPANPSSRANTGGAAAASPTERAVSAHTPSSVKSTTVRALEAEMDGHRVIAMEEAAKIGDIFLIVTGGMSAIDKQHFDPMKDTAIVAKSGHLNVLRSISMVTEKCQNLDGKSDLLSKNTPWKTVGGSICSQKGDS